MHGPLGLAPARPQLSGSLNVEWGEKGQSHGIPGVADPQVKLKAANNVPPLRRSSSPGGVLRS